MKPCRCQPFYAPGTVLKGFVFQELIGAGGYAQVFRVASEKFQQDFAAKVMHLSDDLSSEKQNEVWQTFSAETEALTHLYHPNIIGLYDFFRDGSNFVMILELCAGGTLMDEAADRGLPIQRLATVVSQILDALIYCHEENIPHCDLKPQNMLLDKYGRVKMADFGLSIVQSKDELACKFAGSPVFTPPEIMMNVPHSKFLADIWSFGVMLAMLATGKSPWDATTADMMRQEILHGRYVIRQRVHPIVMEIIQKTLVVQPQRRMSLAEIRAYPLFNTEKAKTAILVREASRTMLVKKMALMPLSGSTSCKSSAKFTDGMPRNEKLRDRGILTFGRQASCLMTVDE